MTHLLPLLPKLKALLCALIVFLPLVVGAQRPEPFSLWINVISDYRSQGLAEPYALVSLYYHDDLQTPFFKGHTDNHGSLRLGLYADLPRALYVRVSRETPDGVLDRPLPPVTSAFTYIEPRSALVCTAYYNWDKGIHCLRCHQWD